MGSCSRNGLDMIREVSTEIKNEAIPEGYQVFRKQNRGYDSPDKWVEVHFNGKKILDLSYHLSIDKILAEINKHMDKKGLHG